VAIPSPDLLTVPGIGPRNMEKLVAKGIAKLANLKQLYLDKVLLSNYL
jgi:predicted flap endonuclease-1-like 5' DNA nuclease